MTNSELEEDLALISRMDAWLRRTQERSFPYFTEVFGLKFIVLEGVFSPYYYPETAFFAEHVLRHVRPGQRYLDVGCGVGVTAVMAARIGAQVVAVDVNPRAVENTVRNCAQLVPEHDVQIRISDVFSALDSTDLFDVIYWNVPFAFLSPDKRLTLLQEAVFDPGYRKNIEFVATAGHHMTEKGELLIGASSTLGHLPAIERVAADTGLVLERVAKTLEATTDERTVLELLRARPSGRTTLFTSEG